MFYITHPVKNGYTIISEKYQGQQMKSKKPKPVINKLLHAVRHNRLWRTRKFLDKKRELKKQGVNDEK